MSSERRRRLLGLVVLIIIAAIIATGGQKVLGISLDAKLVILMIALGATIAFLTKR